jgi:hypothetical protein
MAAPNVFQIVKSNAVLWYAPVGEAVPDETSIDAGDAWGGNWARLGATKEPVTVLYEDEEAEVNVEEYLPPVQRFRISESLTLETVLAELDADYLALMTEGTVSKTAAAGGQKGFEQLPIGNTAFRTDYAWGIEGVFEDSSGNDHPVRIFLYRGTARLAGELSFSKRDDDYTGVPIEIKALTDSGTPGQLLIFQRVTAPAS